MVVLQSVVKCPECGFESEETMPVGNCLIRYDCKNCGYTMKPQGEDCCIFCSFGSEKCPPEQDDDEIETD